MSDLPASGSSSSLLPNLLAFARLLRRLGIKVGARQVRDLTHALQWVDLGDRRTVKAAARAIMVSHQAHLELFDRAFDLFFGLPAEGGALATVRRLERPRAGRVVLAQLGANQQEAQAELEHPLTVPRLAASDLERLRRRDFARLSAEELAAVRRLLRAELISLRPRRSRRYESCRRGNQADPRLALRRAVRTGGELVRIPRRRRLLRARPLVLLADVSGSMEPYSRILLELLWVSQQGGQAVETFAFGTRLTRLTRVLAHRRPDEALRRAVENLSDLGGGTRIGESLARFHRDWAPRVLGRGAVLLVISDGWDRGEPAILGRAVQRLARRVSRLIWLNPLIASEGYEPRSRGIVAVLPHVHDFLPIHNLASLEDLALHLARLGPVGNQARARHLA